MKTRVCVPSSLVWTALVGAGVGAAIGCGSTTPPCTSCLPDAAADHAMLDVALDGPTNPDAGEDTSIPDAFPDVPVV